MKVAALALLAVVIVGVGAYFMYPRDCYPAHIYSKAQGSQGYRIWENEIFISFEHHGRKICVPVGWAPVGAATASDTWAIFDTGRTGVLIRKDAFSTSQIEATGTRYVITLLYPSTTSPEDIIRYTELVQNAFSVLGSFYGDTAAPSQHTVLLTHGLDPDAFVYPDPSKNLTVMMRHPKDPRGEELLIHAVAHLYNRYSDRERKYLEHQGPFTAEEFQELEATWAEIAFAHTDAVRMNRIEYLFHVHSALMNKTYEVVTEPPFNDTSAFSRVVPSIMVPEGGSYLDFQYGHYVLAPLVMVAVDGLLAERGSPATVEQILSDLHRKGEQNFLDRVSSYLTKDDLAAINSWIWGTRAIPRTLIDQGVARY